MKDFKSRNKRGPSYNRKTISELMKMGLSPKDVAKKVGTDSVQSIRHVMEKIQKQEEEREKARDKIATQRKRVDNYLKKTSPILMAIGFEVFEAIRDIFNRTKFPEDSNIKAMWSESGKIFLVSTNLHKERFVKTMERLGFYAELCKEEHVYNPVFVIYADGCEAGIVISKIPFFLFHIEESDLSKSLETLLSDYIIKGEVGYNGINNISFQPSMTVERFKTLMRKIRRSKIHAHIKYNPFYSFPEGKYFLLTAESGILTFAHHNYLAKFYEDTIKLMGDLRFWISGELDRNSLMLEAMNKIEYEWIPYYSAERMDEHIKKRFNRTLIDFGLL